MSKHQYQDLIKLFDQTFNPAYNTQLICGDEEPVYLPANHQCSYHQIVFAHGYYASALHEISHWCLAGEKRRLLEDYGYWYCPDGRSAEKQAEFEVVEVKPQALDWLFCLAADFPFNVSCDNLDPRIDIDRIAFQRKVYRQVLSYLEQGIPPRAAQFINALQDFYHTAPITSQRMTYPQYPTY